MNRNRVLSARDSICVCLRLRCSLALAPRARRLSLAVCSLLALRGCRCNSLPGDAIPARGGSPLTRGRLNDQVLADALHQAPQPKQHHQHHGRADQGERNRELRAADVLSDQVGDRGDHLLA